MQEGVGDTARLERGPYLGDVSALCLLPSSPYLLAGSGPQVLLFDVQTGELLLSQQVFDGVRVHGIHALSDHQIDRSESTYQATVAVHGERRVKVFQLLCRTRAGVLEPKFFLVQSLPRFFQWVLDVRFLQEETSVAGEQGLHLIAVGLSDNSVSIWDLQNCVTKFQVECSERYLLYSLRLWGSTVRTLRVAAGTIFNKVLIWDLRCWIDEECLQKYQEQFVKINESGECSAPLVSVVEPLQELLGHEGSIHRISWSTDGLQIASASDDRSARLWTSSAPDTDLFTAGPILYGHGGRLWDCHIGDNIRSFEYPDSLCWRPHAYRLRLFLLITASEDCTCRLWTPQGHHLATLTGHIGRGIWRCVYDHKTSRLVTAGADSSIKVQSLAKWEHGGQSQKAGEVADQSSLPQSLMSNGDIFCISLVGPNAAGEGSSKPMDSNSEYVRCLALAGPRSLYIATNQGHVHHVGLLENKNQDWTQIYQGEGTGPIVCMSLLVDEGFDITGKHFDTDTCQKDEMVAFGNGLGTATAICVRMTGPQPAVIWKCTWLADHERWLLGIFWTKALGRRFIFTTDPRGLVRVWLLKSCVADATFLEGQCSQLQALLVATCASPLHARIVCLDVCPSAQIIVCGDQRGNLVSYFFPNTLLQQESTMEDGSESPVQLQSIGLFKGAHGISAVASISITSTTKDQAANIISTGRDGCICKFSVKTTMVDLQGKGSGQGLVCTGVEDVTAITVVESVEYCQVVDQKKIGRRLAAGFIASDFVLWDLTHQSELMRVTCGGWRRPHSYVVGDIPEHQYSFAYLKDQVIFLHINWVKLPLPLCLDANKEDKPGSFFSRNVMSHWPLSLHKQFHGREIHSALFIPVGVGSLSARRFSSKWIATGAEDGAVRITRYDAEGVEKLESLMVLGEHRGGSAVRALTLVQEVHSLVQEPPPSVGGVEDHMQDPLLLISVGAKEVLTCWLLEWRQDLGTSNAARDKAQSMSTTGKSKTCMGPVPQADGHQSQKVPVEQFLSSVWLSSYSPPCTYPSKSKGESTPLSCDSHQVETSSSLEILQRQREIKKEKEGSRKEVKEEDDLRFLAVTAFSVRCPWTGSVICFVVTASSDTTLRLLALSVRSRAWVELAVLEYHLVPVLTLQHLVFPIHSISGGWQNAFLVISGATDGSIAVWDITNLVVTFTRKVSMVASDIKSNSETPLRPQTGRGSQGGRRWRSCKQQAGLARIRKDGQKNIDVKGTPLVVARQNEAETAFDVGSRTYTGAEETSMPVHVGTTVRAENEKRYHILDKESLGRGNKTKTIQSSILHPLQTITGAHQSGVNCLSVATLGSREDPIFVVISGGDDQGLHVMRFIARLCIGEEGHLCATPAVDSSENSSGECLAGLEELPEEDSQGHLKRERSFKDQTQQLASSVGFLAIDNSLSVVNTGCMLALECLSQASVPGAHCSAVKGIWTDGCWAFSTGLDQRLRCWQLPTSVFQFESLSQANFLNSKEVASSSVPLVEFSQCLIDVPEAEDLDVEADINRGQYCIAVVGRGLQMMKFVSE